MWDGNARLQHGRGYEVFIVPLPCHAHAITVPNEGIEASSGGTRDSFDYNAEPSACGTLMFERVRMWNRVWKTLRLHT